MMIVLFRCVEDSVPTGTWRADLGERPRMRSVRRGEAMLWLRRGNADDLARAHAWCVAEGAGWHAHPVPTAHDANPLAWARACAERAGPMATALVSCHARVTP